MARCPMNHKAEKTEKNRPLPGAGALAESSRPRSSYFRFRVSVLGRAKAHSLTDSFIQIPLLTLVRLRLAILGT